MRTFASRGFANEQKAPKSLIGRPIERWIFARADVIADNFDGAFHSLRHINALFGALNSCNAIAKETQLKAERHLAGRRRAKTKLALVAVADSDGRRHCRLDIDARIAAEWRARTR